MPDDQSNGRVQQGIKSIEIGARVLSALERGRGPLGLSEVARASDLQPAKAHRYLASLVRTGLASQDVGTGLYDLGPAARRIGTESLRRVDSVRVAQTRATELREASGHTVNLSVWGEHGPTMVFWETGDHTLPMVIRIGSTLPLLDSAVGQIFLAHLSAKATTAVLAAQQRDGATGSLSAEEIDALKRRVREHGHSITKNQMIVGLAALSAPVFGAGGELELALTVVLPARLLTAADSKRLAKQLVGHARGISAELGHTG